MKQKIISLSLVLVMAFGLLAIPALAANPWTKASDWAVPEMERANGQGLIPDALKNKDLTSNVTRAEFAAVAVKVYENLTGTKATAPAKNPFTDTSDAEVLKAYNTGLMVGVSESKFDPGAILNREQMATALTRVLKRAYIPGWTMQADGDYTLNFAQPTKFADDAATSDWAKPSVYFMFAKEIISGTGGNQFSPKQNATREQSVAIGLRIVEKLKGKPLDYAKSGTEPASGENTATQKLNEPFDAQSPWTGTWVSNHYYIGTMTLTQNGNTVTGNISRAGYYAGTTITSTISGTVSGNVLTAIAFRDDVPGYDPDVDGYEFRFVMSENGMEANIEAWQSNSIFGGKSTDGNGEWVWSYPYLTATRIVQTTPPPNGTIDPKLVGVWQRTYSRMPWQTDRLSEFATYAFYEDGTFKHTYTLTLDTFEGKYSASDGKIYLTDISGYRGLANDPTFVYQRGDTVIEYEFGTDEEGRAYLLIANMSNTDNTYIPISGAENFYIFNP